MVLSGVLVLGLHALTTLLQPQEAGATQADHMGSYGPAFYQSYGASGQFTHEFDGEQLFSVDLKRKQAAWRLPGLGDFARFDPQQGLAGIARIRAHLDVLVERSNRTRAPNVPPKVTVLPKFRVELGQPNVLVCIVDGLFPPVVNVTWLRNGLPVTEGAAQTSFYSRPDHLFRKFLYLPLVPAAEDVYDCQSPACLSHRRTPRRPWSASWAWPWAWRASSWAPSSSSLAHACPAPPGNGPTERCGLWEKPHGLLTGFCWPLQSTEHIPTVLTLHGTSLVPCVPSLAPVLTAGFCGAPPISPFQPQLTLPKALLAAVNSLMVFALHPSYQVLSSSPRYEGYWDLGEEILSDDR
ncbi:HLA class II histocompatibility antigen, DO alpha chain isoform X1 [Dasypus novemcinctus]|uniref:HLA class II histocompatibility antigen, DO alpha chain isoform X1 n=1 Tax=Dasypus novemcinctus TaxID=9361 RepID=UPI000328D95D|nr:HLA class II histocompatibility antigen, DO alpha chain isoform X1 [Dasypus novemcinctus]